MGGKKGKKNKHGKGEKGMESFADAAAEQVESMKPDAPVRPGDISEEKDEPAAAKKSSKKHHKHHGHHDGLSQTWGHKHKDSLQSKDREGEDADKGKMSDGVDADDPAATAAAIKIQAAVRSQKAKKRRKAKLKKQTALAHKLAKAKKQAEEKAYEESLQDVSLLFKDGEGAYVHKASDRGCTDVPFLVFFICYWIGALFLAYFAFTTGDIDALIMPRDSEGNSCGLQNVDQRGEPTVDLTDYPALYLPNLALPEQYQICVPNCPGSGSTGTCSGSKNATSYMTGTLQAMIDASTSVVAANTLAASCDTCPARYDAQWRCEAKGDCSSGAVDVTEVECRGASGNEASKLGSCTDGCLSNSDVQLIGADLSNGPGQDLLGKRCCEGLSFNYCKFNQTASMDFSQTNYTYIEYTWTANIWDYDEGDGLIMCKPRGVAGSPIDPLYTFTNGKPDFDFVTASRKSWISSAGPCWLPVFQSNDVVFRCVPTLLADFSSPDAMQSSVTGGAGAQYFKDIADYWFVVPAGAIFALIAAFAWIIFLARFAGYLIWGTVYALELGLPLLGVVCWYQAGIVNSPVEVPAEVQAEIDAAGADTNQAVLEQAGWVCFIAAAVVTIIFCIYKSRIEISIGIRLVCLRSVEH